MSTTDIAVIPFPLGSFRVIVEDGAVRNASFVPTPEPARRDQFGVSDTLAEYFAGNVEALGSLPVVMHGTAFQCEVWRELRRIPAGTTISYGELAKRVDRPTAQRAVGMANGANPIALIVPCHRVIRTGGALGGYYYGLELKRWLLEHEANRLAITA